MNNRNGPVPAAEIRLLLNLIDQAYDHKAWHGPNLRGSVRRVDLATAAWRSGPNRHNIWEIVVHAAYWKYAVRRRLLGEKRGAFPHKGSNWFPRPVTATAEAWAADIALLDQMHRAMRATIAELKPADLDVVPPGSKVNNLAIVSGIAAHDLYHAGQIQLLKRLAAHAL
jgi:DinB family protein